MYHTTNLILYQLAKELSRELRKSQTNAEKIFWEHVRNKKLKGLKFYRQYPIFYEIDNSESFFIADFFCFQRKTIVEIDGKIHRLRKKYDNQRTEILNIIGIQVIRFSNKEVENDIEKVLSYLLKYFSE